MSLIVRVNISTSKGCRRTNGSAIACLLIGITRVHYPAGLDPLLAACSGPTDQKKDEMARWDP